MLSLYRVYKKSGILFIQLQGIEIINMPSTVVASMQYDAERSVLTVVYVSGSVYRYFKVPAQVYAAMKISSSKGTYLNRYIKGNYAFEKVA